MVGIVREFTSLWIELAVRLESLVKESVLVSLSAASRDGSLQPVVGATDEPVRVDLSEEPAEGIEAELCSVTS